MSVIDEVWKVVVDPKYIDMFRKHRENNEMCLPIVTQSIGGLLVPLALFNDVMQGDAHSAYYKHATTLYTHSQAKDRHEQFQEQRTKYIAGLDNQPCLGCEHICETCINK
jgi:hypothetical protein